MPLNSSSPLILHVLQNVLLLSISFLFTPLVTFIALASTLVSPFLPSTKHINHTRKWRSRSSPTFRPRRFLITGVGMAKGLTIARSLYKAGHVVIGADFEPYRIPVCGRFSKALQKFYRVRKPIAGPENGSERYIEDLLNIVKAEKIDVWISCSGVASAVEDGMAKEAVEKHTSCKAVQFDVRLTAMLHEKDSFIENTRSIGLNVPETHLITSSESAMSILHPKRSPAQTKEFILKFVGTDDTIRANMTLLPLSTRQKTEAHLANLKPSPKRPFVLQQFINGAEYCTHSICVRGEIVAFTACESSELLMHYQQMSTSSPLFKCFLQYTQIYAEKMGNDFTGHFSIDFLVDEKVEGDCDKGVEVDELMTRVWPIECNPRAHTANVLFADCSEDLADAYLRVLGEDESNDGSIVIPAQSTPAYYWVGHDIITRSILPILNLMLLQQGLSDLLKSWNELMVRLLSWKDGTFEIWDPWPFWALYVLYWPGMFLTSLLTGNWWSRCNVSTTKMFRC